MSYQNLKLGAALGWKHQHMPGMTTRDGVLTEWPTEPWPTDEELAQWVAEYEQFVATIPMGKINPSIERDRVRDRLRSKIAVLPQEQQEVLNDILLLIKEE